MPSHKISIVMFDRQRQVMTTMSEIVLMVCLVREQLLQYMVAIIQYASEEVVIAIGGKFCGKYGTLENVVKQ